MAVRYVAHVQLLRVWSASRQAPTVRCSWGIFCAVLPRLLEHLHGTISRLAVWTVIGLQEQPAAAVGPSSHAKLAVNVTCLVKLNLKMKLRYLSPAKVCHTANVLVLAHFLSAHPATPPTCCIPRGALGAPLCQIVPSAMGAVANVRTRAVRHCRRGGLMRWAACNHAVLSIRHAGARPSPGEPSHNLPLAGDHGGSTNRPTPLPS